MTVIRIVFPLLITIDFSLTLLYMREKFVFTVQKSINLSI